MQLVLLILSIVGFLVIIIIEKKVSKRKEKEFYEQHPDLKNQLYERTPEAIEYDKYKKAEQRAKDRLKRCDSDRKDNKNW